MKSVHTLLLITGFSLLITLIPAAGSDLDEFKIKREQVFEFTTEPKVVLIGDRATITFETKGFCDVTVAVEDSKGKIVRHLASGVLGTNAPAPFLKNSKKQKIVWDGKNNQGRYIDYKDSLTIRVSLGLKPMFDKSLLWVPQRRLGSWQGANSKVSLPVPLMCPRPEGVYVYEGAGVEHIRLFDRNGKYIRTVYPFPANKLDKVIGLSTYKFPQDGKILPRKIGFIQGTLLTSGVTGQRDDRCMSMYGAAATAFVVRGTRIALTHQKLNRLATDGSTGGLPLTGPKVTFPVRMESMNRRRSVEQINPKSIAFSPDGKYLYLGGYIYRNYRSTGSDYSIKDCLHGVMRMEFAKNEPPKLFAGKGMHPRKDRGKGKGEFTDSTAVAVDKKGRVYVTDYMNDRIQVFSENGKFLKAIKVFKPVKLQIHYKTGEIYVFSWMLHHDSTMGFAGKKIVVPPRLFKLGSFSNPKQLAVYGLPLVPKDHRGRYVAGYSSRFHAGSNWGGLEYNAIVDPYADPVRIWVVKGLPYRGPKWHDYIRIYEIRGDKLKQVYDFSKPVAKTFKKFVLPMYWRQRLYANEVNGKLYVAEQHTAAREKAFREIIEVDPETAKTRLIQLRFDAEDMAFGPFGYLHMRERTIVARYNPKDMREVPFDYGEVRGTVTCGSSSGRRSTSLISGIPIYCGTGWHIGGMSMSVKGNLLISCYVTKGAPPKVSTRRDKSVMVDGKAYGRADGGGDFKIKGRVFKPKFYPGRHYFGEIHIIDRYGKTVISDVVPGLPDMYGVGVDKDNNVYLMTSPTRVLDGKKYFNEMTGTLMKFKPKKGKIITTSRVVPFPISKGRGPKRPPDGIKGGTRFWVEGAEWKYGGVGFCGKNSMYAMGGCACFNSRFYLDYFARSFAPEIQRCQVAVLDTNGNLILRVGQYGNVDSAGPKSLVPLGGDEVGLFYAPYIATSTDRYLWIADPGNQRISSVKLGYHKTARVYLKDVREY